jgi:hypothetical protein
MAKMAINMVGSTCTAVIRKMLSEKQPEAWNSSGTVCKRTYSRLDIQVEVRTRSSLEELDKPSVLQFDHQNLTTLSAGVTVTVTIRLILYRVKLQASSSSSWMGLFL